LPSGCTDEWQPRTTLAKPLQHIAQHLSAHRCARIPASVPDDEAARAGDVFGDGVELGLVRVDVCGSADVLPQSEGKIVVAGSARSGTSGCGDGPALVRVLP
jgi:hypothetical protein